MSRQEPPWEGYEALLAVLHEGSLSAAARALGVAQPTARRRIEGLERALGAVLFARASNGLVPTELARSALPYAESIAASARALARTVSGGADAERGTVRITASEVVAAEVLPPILDDLLRAHPRLELEIAATNRTEDLLRRDADVAVRMVEPVQTGLVRRSAGTVEIGLFAHARYLAGRAAPERLADLAAGHTLVGADRSGAITAALAGRGLALAARDFAFRCDSDLVQLAAVRAGLGIGACHVPLARAPVSLVRVLPRLAFHLDLWVVVHEDLRASARVRIVFDALVAGLARYAAPEGPARAAGPRRR